MSSYFSTVVQSGQVNTPPGSYVTVKEWARNSFLNQQSYLLEIGCSTGFISIETSRYTGARCIGVDLHDESIRVAQSNVDKYIKERVAFQQADAGRLPFEDSSFSHVVISGHLPFIEAQDRRRHIVEALRVLKPWGYVLVALYYYRTSPPEDLVRKFNATVGTKLTAQDAKRYWSELFDNILLSLEYEADYDVVPSDEERVRQYAEAMHPATRDKWKDILQLFNENGRYLSYFVRVYRKIPDEPNLMLQIPRGGIYEIKRKSSSAF